MSRESKKKRARGGFFLAGGKTALEYLLNSSEVAVWLELPAGR